MSAQFFGKLVRSPCGSLASQFFPNDHKQPPAPHVKSFLQSIYRSCASYPNSTTCQTKIPDSGSQAQTNLVESNLRPGLPHPSRSTSSSSIQESMIPVSPEKLHHLEERLENSTAAVHGLQRVWSVSETLQDSEEPGSSKRPCRQSLGVAAGDFKSRTRICTRQPVSRCRLLPTMLL